MSVYTNQRRGYRVSDCAMNSLLEEAVKSLRGLGVYKSTIAPDNESRLEELQAESNYAFSVFLARSLLKRSLIHGAVACSKQLKFNPESSSILLEQVFTEGVLHLLSTPIESYVTVTVHNYKTDYRLDFLKNLLLSVRSRNMDFVKRAKSVEELDLYKFISELTVKESITTNIAYTSDLRQLAGGFGDEILECARHDLLGDFTHYFYIYLDEILPDINIGIELSDKSKTHISVMLAFSVTLLMVLSKKSSLHAVATSLAFINTALDKDSAEYKCVVAGKLVKDTYLTELVSSLHFMQGMIVSKEPLDIAFSKYKYLLLPRDLLVTLSNASYQEIETKTDEYVAQLRGTCDLTSEINKSIRLKNDKRDAISEYIATSTLHLSYRVRTWLFETFLLVGNNSNRKELNTSSKLVTELTSDIKAKDKDLKKVRKELADKDIALTRALKAKSDADLKVAEYSTNYDSKLSILEQRLHKKDAYIMSLENKLELLTESLKTYVANDVDVCEDTISALLDDTTEQSITDLVTQLRGKRFVILGGRDSVHTFFSDVFKGTTIIKAGDKQFNLTNVKFDYILVFTNMLSHSQYEKLSTINKDKAIHLENSNINIILKKVLERSLN